MMMEAAALPEAQLLQQLQIPGIIMLTYSVYVHSDEEFCCCSYHMLQCTYNWYRCANCSSQ